MRWERHANIDVVAMRAPTGALHVLIVDDDPPGSRVVAMRLAAATRVRAGSVLELRAASPQSSSGVTLGHATVAADGTWRLDDAASARADHAGDVSVLVPPSSADLVTLTPAQAPRPTRTHVRTGRPRTRAGRG
jgi:hypothetical protein